MEVQGENLYNVSPLTTGGHWWSLVANGSRWWSLVVTGGCWWPLMVAGSFGITSFVAA